MNKLGAIIVVDDDHDDNDLLCRVYEELEIPNEVICFDNVKEALTYLRLKETDPFLILSNVRMPKTDGFEFRKLVNEDQILTRKAIPFLLFSAVVDQHVIERSLLLGAQGVFIKPLHYRELFGKMQKIDGFFRDCFAL